MPPPDDPPSGGGWQVSAVEQTGKVFTTLARRVSTPVLALAALVYLALLVTAVVAGSALGIAGLAVLAVAGLAVLGMSFRHERATPSRADERPDCWTLTDRLDVNAQRAVQRVIREAARATARTVDLPEKLVRSNVFAVTSRNTLRIVPTLTHGMSGGSESSLEVPIGVGSNGRAFASRMPNIATSRGKWREDRMPPGELAKLDERLKWVVSIPVFRGESRAEPAWVLNVDGLERALTAAALRPAVGELLKYAELLSETLTTTLGEVRGGSTTTVATGG
jgi:hypothetical protein